MEGTRQTTLSSLEDTPNTVVVVNLLYPKNQDQGVPGQEEFSF